MFALLQSFFAFLFARLGTFIILAAVLIVVTALALASRHYFQDAQGRIAQIDELIELRQQHAEHLRSELERLQTEAQLPLRELRRRLETSHDQLLEIQRRLVALDERRQQFSTWWLRTKSWFSAEAREELHQLEEQQRALAAEQQAAERQLTSAQTEHSTLLATRSSEVAQVESKIAATHAEIARWEEDRSRLAMVAAERQRTLDAIRFWLVRGWDAAIPGVIALALGLFLLPPVMSVALYYLWAPWVEEARPVLLANRSAPAPIRVSASSPAREISVLPGHRVILHHNYYQASDDGLEKRTRFLFDWRFPFTSIACRLTEMTEVTNAQSQLRRITVSNQTDPACEISTVELPKGASLILRPRFLIAIGLPAKALPRIRAHWRFTHLHAWITLQFRYFEFTGPCTLVVRGQRGIRAESVDAASGTRRTNQRATVGFVPSLHYLSLRAETFWSYFRGRNALYDDAFRGEGVFLCQQISQPEEPAAVRFWRGIGDVLLKIFGL